MYYRTEFCRSALNGVSINTGEPPKNREHWNSAILGWEAWLIPRYTPLHHTCYPAELGCPTSNDTSIIKEIRLKKIDPSRPTVQGHSRSSQPTWIDPPPMASY